MDNPWIWILTTAFALFLCTWLPIRIQDDRLRKWTYWIILVPVSLVILFYIYPVGIELFRRWAVGL